MHHLGSQRLLILTAPRRSQQRRPQFMTRPHDLRTTEGALGGEMLKGSAGEQVVGEFETEEETGGPTDFTQFEPGKEGASG